jgi:Sulfotransferase domain
VASASPHERPLIVYVGGAGRSGSTLLGRMAGQLDGVVHVGELIFIWRRGVIENQLCGCGHPFLDCPFWTSVGKRAFGGWDVAEAERIESMRAAVERNRYIPQLLSPVRRPAFATQLDGYLQRLDAVYDAIAEVSDCRTIVETSKGPAHALVLRLLRNVDLRVCLLVRDSRGVAYSWTRRRLRTEIPGAEIYMDTYSPVRTAVEWAGFNTAFSLMPLLGVPTQRVRYEDVMDRPGQEIARLAEFARPWRPAESGFTDSRTVRLDADHSVAGNPSRFSTGEVELVPDYEWVSAMPGRQRSAMTLMTAPWLLRYGYLGHPGSDAQPDQPKSRPR